MQAVKTIAIALLIDQQYYLFKNVPESATLYIQESLFFLKPWKHIAVYFGGQCCYSGYIYCWDLHKKIFTEFGILEVEARLTFNVYPLYIHHFTLEAYPVIHART